MAFFSQIMLSGAVSSFCVMLSISLTYFGLFSNLLTGQQPKCWEKFQNLKVLNLANNSFSGRIPETFGT